MIYFVTDRKDHLSKGVEDELKIIKGKEFYEEHYNELIANNFLGIDTETSGLDAYKNNVILTIIGTKENQYVIDNSCRDCAIATIKQDITFIGHNLKFDYKMLKIDLGISLEKMYDTMLVEQRISQNYTSSYYMGYISFSLEEVVKKRLKLFENGMNKNIRTEFIRKDPDTFQLENKHIVYAANDIKYLFDIRDQQLEIIKKRKIEKLIFDIELPLIKVLADAELEGWILNEKKWLNLAKNNKHKKFLHETKLDNELRRLRDIILPEEDRVFLKNGKFDRNRNKKEEIQNLDLFNQIVDTTKQNKIQNKLSPNINYSSSDVLVTILGRLKQPVPTKDGTNIIPKFVPHKTGGYKIDKSIYSFTTGAGAIENYLAENPSSPIKSFIQELISYRETCTRLNTFGENFVKAYTNPITGRIHTVFRQMFTSTGRLQSGSKRKKKSKSNPEADSQENYFNSQNIPAEKDYRECFEVGKDYEVISSDYSGCEAVVMIDKAKDEKFYEFAIKNDDAHSPIAQNVWRAIGQYRVQQGHFWNTSEWEDEDGKTHIFTPEQLADIQVSKKINKFIRTGYKNNTFAVCYGCGIRKYSKTLRVSDEEGKIGIRIQKGMFPKTFKFLDTIAKQAITQGYVVINSRTNSVVWYPEVLEALRNKSDLPNNIKHDIESSARNITIQGTNADIVKEAMVELTEEFKYRKLDAMVLGSVHDEIIVKARKNIGLIECEINGEILPLTIGEFVKYIMEIVANRYLSFIKMKAEFKTLNTWTK